MPQLHAALGYPYGGPAKEQAIKDLERYAQCASSVSQVIEHFRCELERGGDVNADTFADVVKTADSLHRNLRNLQDATA